MLRKPICRSCRCPISPNHRGQMWKLSHVSCGTSFCCPGFSFSRDARTYGKLRIVVVRSWASFTGCCRCAMATAARNASKPTRVLSGPLTLHLTVSLPTFHTRTQLDESPSSFFSSFFSPALASSRSLLFQPLRLAPPFPSPPPLPRTPLSFLLLLGIQRRSRRW